MILMKKVIFFSCLFKKSNQKNPPSLLIPFTPFCFVCPSVSCVYIDQGIKNPSGFCLAFPDNDVFSINGLEIDLKELELFEKRIKAKKLKNTTENSIVCSNNDDNYEVDDLDEYLAKLKLDREAEVITKDDDGHDVDEKSDNLMVTPPKHQSPSLPLLIVAFTGILFLLNSLKSTRRKRKTKNTATINESNQNFGFSFSVHVFRL